jgi:hypothetical protein
MLRGNKNKTKTKNPNGVKAIESVIYEVQIVKCGSRVCPNAMPQRFTLKMSELVSRVVAM